MTVQDDFRADIEAFLQRHQMKPAAFGSQALKDPKFVFDLRKGRSPSLKTIDKVRAWMADYDAAHGTAEDGAAAPAAGAATPQSPPVEIEGEARPVPPEPSAGAEPGSEGAPPETGAQASDEPETEPPRTGNAAAGAVPPSGTPPPPVGNDTASDPPPPKPRRRWRMKLLMVLIAVAVVIGGLYYLRPDLVRRAADMGRGWLAERIAPDTRPAGDGAAQQVTALTNRIENLQTANERLASRIGTLEKRLEKLTETSASDGTALSETRLDDMEKRIAALEAGGPAAGDGERVTALEKEIESLRAAQSEIENRIKALGRIRAETDNLRAMVKSVQGRLAELAGVSDDVATLRSEMADTETRVAELAGLPKTVSALTAEMDKLQAAVPEVENVDALAARVAEIEESMTGIRALESDITAASLTTAFLRLDAAVRTGDPYTASLALFRQVGGGHGGVPAQALERLKRYADKGVPTQTALEQRFSELIPTVLRTTAESDTWWERLEARLRNLVIVRKQGDVAGADPSAVVARAEAALEAGDLGRAVKELGGLPPVRRKIVAPWIADVRARDTALSALAEIAEWIPEDEGQG